MMAEKNPMPELADGVNVSKLNSFAMPCCDAYQMPPNPTVSMIRILKVAPTTVAHTPTSTL